MKTVLRRVLKVLLLTFQPLPRVKRWVQMVLSALILVGLPIVAHYWERIARPNLTTYMLAVVVLGFIAAYRLQEQLDVLTTPVLEICGLELQAENLPTILGYRLYYFYVRNPGASFIERIEVQLEKIEPELPTLKWLPVHLHQKHDNTLPFKTSFDLSPRGEQMVDLVDSALGWGYLRVAHAVSNVNMSLPRGEFVFHVKAQAKNIATPTRAKFRVFINADNVVECHQLQ